MQKIGIVGAGAWGTALAQVLAKAEKDVTLWAREADVVKDINDHHKNSAFLPGIDLHTNIIATSSLSELADCDLFLIVTPAQFMRNTLNALASVINPHKPIVICAKGIEIDSGMMMSEIAKEELLEHPVGVLSGPTFAKEIAEGKPSAVTLAIKDKDIGQEILDNLNTRTLRIYSSNDLIGVQIGGAVKNVIAVACGVAAGMDMGESTRAALITRGLAEMSRLVSSMDGKKTTLMGMCGIGDLVLTCQSEQSRNFSLGLALGQGRALEEILDSRDGKCVTEGYHTAVALKKMADSHAVDMPISQAVYECLHEGKSIEDSIADLLDRPAKSSFVS